VPPNPDTPHLRKQTVSEQLDAVAAGTAWDCGMLGRVWAGAQSQVQESGNNGLHPWFWVNRSLSMANSLHKLAVTDGPP
jgi:hypothetical protein